MNIFQSNAAQFRRGSAFDDAAENSTPNFVLAALLGEADTESKRDSTASKAGVADLSTLLATAQQQRHEQHPKQTPRLQQLHSDSPQLAREFTGISFPSTPYYGLLSRCEVEIDVALTEGLSEDSAKPTAFPYNPSSTVHRLSHLQRLLNTCAETHGAVYFFGSSSSPYESATTAATSPPFSAAASTSAGSSITYTTYVEAMQDGFRRIAELRTEGPSAASTDDTAGAKFTPTQHCFYMRFLGHPRWKDLALLLCVEHGRLLLCLLSTSRVTQKMLTALCAEVGVSLEWLSGAALLVEPQELQRAEVNPVWAAWDSVIRLPLHSTETTTAFTPKTTSASEKEGGEASEMAPSVPPAEGDVSSGVRAVLDSLQRANTPLRGFQLALVASVPFTHARRCGCVGRFVEEAVLYASDTPTEEQKKRDSNDDVKIGAIVTSKTGGGAATGAVPGAENGGLAAGAARRPVARRYLWRVLPTQAWLLPHFVTRLTHCLAETCALCTFTLRCSAPAVDAGAPALNGGDGARTNNLFTPHSDISGTGGGVAGVRLVRGAGPSFMQLRRGPSTVAWTAFSRLSSGAAWVDEETREGLALHDSMGGAGFGGLGEESEEGDEALELEFELNSVRYRRSATSTSSVAADAALLMKRPRDTSESTEVAIRPELWGPSFMFGVSVKRVIVVEDGEQ